MILYRNATDQEILDFYEELAGVIKNKSLRIFYLETGSIDNNIEIIRKDRSDENGNEMWFPLMIRYFNESPYAQSRGVSGEEELYKHFLHRQELELRICREFFPNKVTVLKSKAYTDNEL